MDWSNPIGSAISGAFGLIGSAVNYKYQKDLAAQQNQYNLDMWKMQADYNSPANQMKRFEEAGLNPALMYSQGNGGNMVSSPQMVTPNAPDISQDMKDLAQAFNIEGLRTAIANRKKAQAEARITKATAEDLEGTNEATRLLESAYYLNPATGKFEARPGYSYIWDSQGPEGHLGFGKLMRILSDNYRTNSLLVPRAGLIGSQRSLNAKREELFAPQIRYWNFNTTPWRMKTNFWIGNVKQGAQALGTFF